MQEQGAQAKGWQGADIWARYDPGVRVVIRDCEWIVRQADPSVDSGYVLTVDGLSQLVSGKSARCLTWLKEEADAIRVLDPAETRFEQDLTPGFERSRLFIETQLRQITPADARIHLSHKVAMDPVPYQLDPARQALKQNRQRIMIADAVGLGKTLEAGILTTELMRRGRGKRILVLTLKSMITQFQKELWNRFTIPLTRLDSVGLQRVRNHVPGNHNPFYYYDKSIVSIDTRKQDNEYRRHLEQAYWDIIVIDEAHKVAERGASSRRARLAQLLAGRSNTLIMLSATPHDGKARSFASLTNMLDPTAISDPEDYVREDFRDKDLVIRRFKKDIRDQVQQAFKERLIKDLYLDASPQEEAAYQAILDVPFTYRGDHNHRFVLHKLSAKQLTDQREAAFARSPELEAAWFAELAEAEGGQAFLNAPQNYPQLEGQRANLYKCFLPRAWDNANEQGVSGFLHPEGIYDDPKGAGFRRELNPRLCQHFQFINETKLFAEVYNQTLFSINVHGPFIAPGFKRVSNLFIPGTIDLSFAHDGEGQVPGIKEEVELPDGRVKVKWGFAGHLGGAQSGYLERTGQGVPNPGNLGWLAPLSLGRGALGTLPAVSPADSANHRLREGSPG
ncbi:hypothetical protein C6W88_19785 [Halomonas litopenaei]|uniref:Helicase ATP-binding domain-containing protein n=1 Tax=Halomonas litopenaei TaxID=2109328 RepID=A0ABX5IRP9_9GAMM|nr:MULTISPECIES: DEAD/DEAH box helicase [Halomonas]PTL89073.1 hypothetical protein C6W88_19785 [Halomonas litopenaei]PTL89349.1 hypothetical protein C6W89_18495 [Halomonas sp. SYSU XM8]